VREEATDWYLRARSDLLKSILDELDYEQSAANFILAKQNLDHHGFEVLKGPDDFLCDIVAKEEVDNARKRLTLEEFERLAAEGEDGEKSSAEGKSDRERLRERGREKDEDTYLTFGRLPDLAPDHHWRGRFQESNLHDFVSLFPDAEFAQGSLYPDDHHFQARHHPLRQQNVVSGLPAYLETLKALYLPSRPGAVSLAEQIKRHESLQEDHHSKKGNMHFTGVKDKMRGDTSHHFAGPLHDSHLHDLYLHNFEEWKRNNSSTVDALVQQYPNAAEHDYAIAQAHMDDAIQGWVNTEMGEGGRRTSLGWGGYNLGLEWLSPEDRENVVQHLMERGSTGEAHDVQNIKLSDGRTISAGRVKRNIAHRFTPEFLHSMRGQIYPSQNQRKHVESESDVANPQSHNYSVLHDALHETPHEEHGTMAQAIINALNEKHADEGVVLSNLNFLRKKGLTEQAIGSSEPLTNMFNVESGGRAGIDESSLHRLLGIKRDKEGNYSFTGKGHFGESDAPLSLDDLKALEGGKSAAFSNLLRHKSVRHADAYSHLGFNGPHEEHIPEDEADLWMRTPHGPVGNGAIFHLPFIRGGSGRSALARLEILHDWMPKDAEGKSLIGSLGRDGIFTPSSKNVGLFGRYVPPSRGFRTHGEGDTHAQAQSFWDASHHQKRGKTQRFASRNTKNTPMIGHSTLDPGFANMLGALTPEERIDLLGKDFTERLDSDPASLHNALMAGGVDGVETRYAQNSRLTHNVTSRLGRLHPPHEPFEKEMLRHDELDSPKESVARARSHDQGNPRAFAMTHKLSGRSVKELPVRATTEFLENLEDASMQAEKLEALMSTYAGSDEGAPAELRERYFAALERVRHLESVEGMTETGKPAKFHHSNFDKKMSGDLEAIKTMAQRIKPIMEKVDPEAFDPSNKVKFLANSSRLYHDANRMLMLMPHDKHGLTTWGRSLDTEERESASAIASKVTGETVVPHRNILSSIMNHGAELTQDMTTEQIMEALGFDHDKNDPDYQEHYKQAEKIRATVPESGLRAMTSGTALSTGMQFHPRGQDISLSHEHHTNHIKAFDEAYAENPAVQAYRSEESERKKGTREGGRGKTTGSRRKEGGSVSDFLRNYSNRLGAFTHLFRGGYQNEAGKYGLTRHAMGEVRERGKDKAKIKSLLHDIITVNPSVIDPALLMDAQIDQNKTDANVIGRRLGQQIHPAASLKGNNIGDYYVAGVMEHGYKMQPTVGVEWDGNNIVAGSNMPDEQYLHSIQRPMLEAVHGKDVVDSALSGVGLIQSQPNAITATPATNYQAENTNPDSIGKSLMALMDPDVLMKNDGKKPMPILPMHRIFSLKDFASLRGFSGEWAASLLPEGERFIVRRKSGRVTAYDSEGDVSLSSEDKTQFKALTEKNFLVDAVRHDDEIHLVDIIEYDDTNVADMSVRERLKVLRGQFDSHEHVIVPGPHNLRLTDSEGLPDVIESLKESGNRILLRDATSTYMRGERRHPKWFLLRPDKKVSLIVLDVRGKGPYTYRLGAGPLDAEGFGNRGVEHEGESFLDVGTVTSPKPFNEGDVVNVSVSGVRSRKRGDKTIYDVTASKVAGESDDSPASLETLSLLTKSHPVIPVQFSVDVESDRLILSFPEVDTVIYKMETNRHGTWAHSPKSTLGELQGSEYSLLLAESLRPLWSPAASLMLKGVKVAIESEARSMSDPKHREESEKESAGVIDADDDAAIIKPKRLEVMTKTLLRIADLVDRVEKEKMTGGPGARGMGIDVASGIESPRGPTSLMSEESLPDWDMIDRPTEDPEEEYPAARNKRLKEKTGAQSTSYEAESEND